MARRRGMKIVGIILLVLVVLLSLGITFTIGWRPIIGAKKRALTDRKFDVTPARLERGRYLVDETVVRLRGEDQRDDELQRVGVVERQFGVGMLLVQPRDDLLDARARRRGIGIIFSRLRHFAFPRNHVSRLYS